MDKSKVVAGHVLATGGMEAKIGLRFTVTDVALLDAVHPAALLTVTR